VLSYYHFKALFDNKNFVMITNDNKNMKNTVKKACCRFLQSWQEEVRRTAKRLAPAESQQKKEK